MEDLSYSLRVPVTYVPRYMGDMRKFIETGAAFKGQKPKILTEEQKQENLMQMEID